MSQWAACGRVTPRWSVGSQLASAAGTSSAGLPSGRAIVSVGPPLFWSAPSIGSAEVIPPQSDPGYCRLAPASVIAPPQFPPDRLFATMVFESVSVPPFQIPPPVPAPLPEKVELVTVATASLEIPPPVENPANVAELPEKVLFVTLSVPELFQIPPPPEKLVELPEKVPSETIAVPPRLPIPPPQD